MYCYDCAEDVVYALLRGSKIMENNKDVMLEFFLIRQSVVVCSHLPSVECVDHYLAVPGFVIRLNRDVAVQNSSCGIVLMHNLSEMDMFLMTGIVWLPAQVICRERERGREREEQAANKAAVAEGYR